MSEIRPTSPHLSIYKLQFTSAFSIAHRLTGCYIFLYMVAVLNLCLLEPSAVLIESSLFIQLMIVLTCLFNFALAFHISTGIRYLLWGFRIGVNLDFVEKSIIPLIISIAIIGGISSYLLLQKIPL